MTHRILALLLIALWLGACGKYGSPIRPAQTSSGGGVVQGHADTCEDPEHDHTDPPEPTP